MAAADALLREPPGSTESPEQTAPAVDPDVVEVSAEDDDQEDDEPAQRAERPPRQERRNNRYREVQERAERAEREAESARIRVEQAERRAAAYEAQLVAGRIPGRQPRPQEDEYRSKRRELVARQRRIHEQFAELPEDQQNSRRQEFEDRLIDLEDESKELWSKHKGTPAVDTRKLVSEAQAATFAAENQDIMGDPRKRALMSSIWTEMVGYQQKPKNFDTARAAVAETRRRLGMTGANERTPAEKARFGGPPRTTGSGGGSGESKGKTMAMNRDMRRMAEARYPELPAEKAHKKWVASMLAKD